MAINPELLIAAAMLQDYLVDKPGIPMAYGTITCYQDNSRTTLKNWYYQSGTPGNYTYIRLPNPLTLSAAGTICDINGVDTIPFYYPYSELDETVLQPYYITIVNYQRTNQITRANFPFITEGGVIPPPISGNSATNLIVNNGFWRNIQPNYVNSTPYISIALNDYAISNAIDLIVSPSQHDGFRMPDVTFIKNNISGIDALTFTPFPLADFLVIGNPITVTPEYYINHTCSVLGSGETQKCYQFPIALHINNLANVPFTVTIEAQNGGGIGTGQDEISLFILQDTGSGTSSPMPTLISGSSITLNSSWQTYILTSVFPPTTGLVLGEGEDDALYLQVQMPLNALCSINFTKPSIYLTTGSIPFNDFQTYDQVNSIISSPRTGDIRTSINSFYFFGWLPMNDGVIGLNAMSVIGTALVPGYARGNPDTWQLFNLLWSLAKPYDTGSNFNPICQMYTNNGSALIATNYGGSAYADFSANNALALTKMFGKVLMGTVPMDALIGFYVYQSQGVVASNSSGNLLLTATSGVSLWQGAPIVFNFSSSGSLPGNINANTVYYITNISSTTFNVAITYADAIAGTPVIAWSSAGSSVYFNFDPTGISIGEYAHTQLIPELASHTHTIPTVTSTGSATGFTRSTLSTSVTQLLTGSTGSSTPFNVTQPGTFYNMYIKL
jgi:hypothetical protein